MVRHRFGVEHREIVDDGDRQVGLEEGDDFARLFGFGGGGGGRVSISRATRHNLLLFIIRLHDRQRVLSCLLARQQFDPGAPLGARVERDRRQRAAKHARRVVPGERGVQGGAGVAHDDVQVEGAVGLDGLLVWVGGG